MAGVKVKKLDGLMTAGQWFEVRPARPFDHVLIANRGSVELLLRSDDHDETSELAIPAGNDQPIVAPYIGGGSRNRRFTELTTAFYLQVASGTGEGVTLIWT